MTETHYDALQVARTASPEVIRAAYKSLSQRWHPDRNPDNRAEAEYRMKGINAAYEELSNPQRRASYDARLEAETEAQPRPRPQQPPSSPQPRYSTTNPRHSVSAWMWLLLAVGGIASIIVAAILWESPTGKIVVIVGGAVLAIFVAHYRSREWQKSCEEGNSRQAVQELSWLITGVAWAWLPFALGMTWERGSALSVQKLPYYALLFSAWIPAYAIAKALINHPSSSPDWKKVYGLLLFMCTIQVMTYFLFNPIGQREWLKVLGYNPSDIHGHGMVMAQLLGVVIGGILTSILYALLLFVIGMFVGHATTFGLRHFSGRRIETQTIALIAGWGLIPLLAFGGLLWKSFNPQDASTPAPSPIQPTDPLEQKSATEVPPGYQPFEGELD